ncbi:Wzz/FepE/Etk N-terminal domain-containing protein [uncultured Algibacter sp.]|uniref:Wzz/FepE/Etk N-terminal domain-containing protein n=1 Tax=uncultured Algibacter sp. TaxID=298659 RepID=UPI00261330C6|nr:Wzz/FepE/Etk N-terminal domain-containing protein [uncultured Algibacter sp.]
MANNYSPKPDQEEVDLGQLFKLIGSAFERFFNFFKSIFKSILNVFVFLVKALLNNYKLIILSIIVAGVLGFALEKMSKDVYTAQMIVKPYFDSKYQLVTNIDYYNALIKDKDYKRLNSAFNIDEEALKGLIEFEMNPGPETENERALQYENFLKGIDSIRREDFSFKDFVENRSIYSGDLFEIKVKSSKKDIFKFLEKGLNSTFSNEYSMKKMKKRDSIILIEKERIQNSLNQVDSLKRVYINVMQSESNSNNGPLTLKDGMSLVQERVQTKEYELLTKELDLRKELTALASEQIEENEYFDTISSFQEIGFIDKELWERYSLILPALTFVLLCIGFLFRQLILFVKSY